MTEKVNLTIAEREDGRGRHYKLSGPPPAGFAIDYRGRRYVCRETMPYTRRRDGAESAVVRWETECEICDAGCEITSGLAFGWLPGLCPACLELYREEKARMIASGRPFKTSWVLQRVAKKRLH